MPTVNTPQRFQSGLIRMPSGCLEWAGFTNPKGYGRLSYEGKPILAHRLAWTLAHGPILSGMEILHHCDNPPCCEPYGNDHLFVGTNTDNMRDKIAKGRDFHQRITHCPQNHPYNKVNTYVRPDGWRDCKTCMADRQRQYLSAGWIRPSRRRLA